MIQIVKNNNWCNCCDSKYKNDPIAIRFSFDNSGHVITLCKDCREELARLLKDRENPESEV